MIFNHCSLFVIVYEDGPLEEGRPLVIHTPPITGRLSFYLKTIFALSVKVSNGWAPSAPVIGGACRWYLSTLARLTSWRVVTYSILTVCLGVGYTIKSNESGGALELYKGIKSVRCTPDK